MTKNLIAHFGTSKSIRTQDRTISLVIRLVGCVGSAVTNHRQKFRFSVLSLDEKAVLLVVEPERVPFRVCK